MTAVVGRSAHRRAYCGRSSPAAHREGKSRSREFAAAKPLRRLPHQHLACLHERLERPVLSARGGLVVWVR